jgi:uncharacterized membrane protein affecting hemolysin expression
VNLPPPSDLVKPDRLVLAVAAVAVVLTTLMVLLVLHLTSREAQRMDRFGNAAVQALAELAVEPLMQRDRMHLGVIGNRLAELDEIEGVASYGADNRILATTGSLEGRRYTQPVTLDDSIVGYVHLALRPAAFAASTGNRTAALLIVMLLMPFAVAGGWALAGAARAGRLDTALPWRQPPAAPAPLEEAPVPEAAADVRHYLLAINLYNQLTLQIDQRDFELSLCLELAEVVAEIYQGQVVNLPGVGVLVDFDHTDDGDRPFQVLCAAFLLLRLLHDEAPFGQYRLGLNLTELPADEALAADHDAVADAALLSALARDASIAVSATVVAVLDNTARLRTRPLVNPLLDELATSSADCRLVTDLEAPYHSLVVQQAAQLRDQREATSSPSTF